MGEKADLAEELSSSLGDVRRSLSNEVKLRQAVIKPLESAVRALKDPHRNALALHEAGLKRSLIHPKNWNCRAVTIRSLAEYGHWRTRNSPNSSFHSRATCAKRSRRRA